MPLLGSNGSVFTHGHSLVIYLVALAWVDKGVAQVKGNGFTCDQKPNQDGQNCFCNRLIVKAQMACLDDAVGNISAALKAKGAEHPKQHRSGLALVGPPPTPHAAHKRLRCPVPHTHTGDVPTRAAPLPGLASATSRQPEERISTPALGARCMLGVTALWLCAVCHGNTGMWDNTIFVVMGDNGGPTFEAHSNTPFRGGKLNWCAHRRPAGPSPPAA